MNKIPTAEEFLKSQGVPEEHLKNLPWFDYGNMLTWLEEYSNIKATYHVEAALKAAADKAKIDESWENNDWESENPEGFTVCRINKDSILNAYPKENIQ